MAWGWRIPFLISIVLVAVGLFIRLAVMESPAFKEVKDSGTASDKPLVDLVKDHKRDVLTAMGMRIAENGCFYIFTVFVLAYGEETLNLSKNTMLTGVVIAAALGLLTVPFYGWLSDRFGRRKLYMAGAVFTLLFAFPFFALLDTKEPVLIWLAIVLAVNVGHDLMYGPQAAYFSELFADAHALHGRLGGLPARVGVRRRLRPADRGRAAGGGRRRAVPCRALHDGHGR